MRFMTSSELAVPSVQCCPLLKQSLTGSDVAASSSSSDNLSTRHHINR